MCGNNTLDTYFNVIAVVNACQVGIDRVLMAEHPKRRKGASGNRSSTYKKKSKRVAIKKKKTQPSFYAHFIYVHYRYHYLLL